MLVGEGETSPSWSVTMNVFDAPHKSGVGKKDSCSWVRTKPRPHGVLPSKTFKTKDDGHGRIETRKCTVMKKKSGECLEENVFNEWPSLNTWIRIESERVDKVTGEKSQETTRHFISSHRDLSGEKALSHVRKHWEIENKLHWSLDVTFREDEKRNRSGNSANNCAILRKMAFNLLHMDPSDKTLPLKQQKAAGDNTFLLKLLLRNSIKSHKKHKKE